MNKAKLNITEFIKTIVIYALVFSMMSAAGVYMNARQNAGQPEEVPWEKRRIIESGGIVPSAIQINPNHVSPLQITVTSDSKSVTAVYNPKLISEIYKDFTDIILALFGNFFECEVLSGEFAAEYWDKCVGSPDSVYIKYAGEHIYPVIYAFLTQSVDSPALTAMDYESPKERVFAKVHELFIIPEKDGDKFYGIAKDNSGNVSVFRLKNVNLDAYSDYPNYETYEIFRKEMYGDFIDSVDFAAYNDTVGIVLCKFLKDGEIWEETGFNKNDIKNLELPGDFHLYDDYTYSSVLTCENPVLAEYNALDTQPRNEIKKLETITRILKVFNYNAESVAFYSAEENGKFGKRFRENHGSLTIFENGQIFFQYVSAETSNAVNINGGSNRGGIHLSNLLGYDTNYYTFYEKLKAASIFINSLTPGVAGLESDLYLTDIKVENDNLTAIFSYYHGGVQVKSNSRALGAYIVIAEDSIVEAEIDALNTTSVGTAKAKNLKQTTVLSYFEGELLRAEDGDSLKEAIEYDPEKQKFIIKELELIYNTDNVKNMQIVASWTIR